MTFTPCQPDVRQSPRGWQANTPPSHPFRIGVVGDTREEAEARFQNALARWEELHERAEAQAEAQA